MLLKFNTNHKKIDLKDSVLLLEINCWKKLEIVKCLSLVQALLVVSY